MSPALPRSPGLDLKGTGAAVLRLTEGLLANRAVGWLRAFGGPLTRQPAAQPLERLIRQCLDAAASGAEAGAVPGRAGGRAPREGPAPWPDQASRRAPVAPLWADPPGPRPALPEGAALDRLGSARHAPSWPAPTAGLAAVRPGAAVSANEALSPDAAPGPTPRPAQGAARPSPLTTTALAGSPAAHATVATASHGDGAAATAGFALRRQGQAARGQPAAGGRYPAPAIPAFAPAAAATGFGAATPAAAAQTQPLPQASRWRGQGAIPAVSARSADAPRPITAIEVPPAHRPTRLVTDLTALQGLLQSAVADSRQRHALPALLPTVPTSAELAATPGPQLVASPVGPGPAPATPAAIAGTPFVALDALAEDILVDRLADRLQDRLREQALRHLGFTGGVV